MPTLNDPAAWWLGDNRTQVGVSRANGDVTVTVPATAGDGFIATLETRCKIVGDFDARVSFDLPEWSGADGIWVSLMASDLGGVNTYRTDAFGESYGTYIPPNPGPPTVPASGTTGTLRLTRQGSTITGSYLAGGNWVPISDGAGPTKETAFTLGVWNDPKVATFAGRPATVSFHAFSLTAESLDC